MLVMVVEADLAVGNDLLVLRKMPDDFVGGMEDVLYLVGMDADRGVDEVVLVREQDRVAAGLHGRPDGDDIFDARFPCSLDHVVAVVIELEHLKVRSEEHTSELQS